VSLFGFVKNIFGGDKNSADNDVSVRNDIAPVINIDNSSSIVSAGIISEALDDFGDDIAGGVNSFTSTLAFIGAVGIVAIAIGR